MKALTVQQPWAWSIFYGKNIENRTQQWSYRGPLAIHAGSQWSEGGSVSRLVHGIWLDATEHDTPSGVIINRRLPRSWFDFGAIIGVVDLVDVHREVGCCKPWGEESYRVLGGGVVHLVLEHPRLLSEPIPCRGALGLWTPPTDVIERIQTAP